MHASTLVFGSVAVLIGLAVGALPARAAEKPVTIVAFGDSLTAGYGVGPDESFPVRLERSLKADGRAVTVVNAGVSGDTTADGLARLDWSIPPEAEGVIVEFGANDAFRGVEPARMAANLDAIATALAGRRLPFVIAGMKAPRNLGADYAAAFDASFAAIAGKHGAILYPFFLDGVILDPGLNQRDGIHPNPKGVDVIVSRILPTVETLVDQALERRK